MKTQNLSDASLLMARLILGTVIAGHGAQKLLGWFGGFGFYGTMEFFTSTIAGDVPCVRSFLRFKTRSCVDPIFVRFTFYGRPYGTQYHSVSGLFYHKVVPTGLVFTYVKNAFNQLD